MEHLPELDVASASNVTLSVSIRPSEDSTRILAQFNGRYRKSTVLRNERGDERDIIEFTYLSDAIRFHSEVKRPKRSAASFVDDSNLPHEEKQGP